MDIGWMHGPYFAWQVCKHRSEDCIADIYNEVEQLWLDLVAWISPREHCNRTGGLNKSNGALGWTSGLNKFKWSTEVDWWFG
jgi:hypothetical protein